jgi:hypothetical protein
MAFAMTLRDFVVDVPVQIALQSLNVGKREKR